LWLGQFIAAVGEFVGTTLFLLFALGGTNVSAVVSNGRQLDTSQLLYIALCFGFSLTIKSVLTPLLLSGCTMC
jgi:aquaporin related protein